MYKQTNLKGEQHSPFFYTQSYEFAAWMARVFKENKKINDEHNNLRRADSTAPNIYD